jgi:hypothetical protein
VPARSPRLAAGLRALFVTCLRATSRALIKLGPNDIPALTFAAVRYGLAFLCLVPFALHSEGVLTAASAERLVIRVAGFTPELVEVRLRSDTQICRRTCQARWSDLRIGDRAAAGTYIGENGVRFGRWVNANTMAGWGSITRVAGNVITVFPDMGEYATGATPVKRPGRFEHDLLIEAHTTVYIMNEQRYGPAHDLKVGDYIHYTATAATPNRDVRQVWAMTIHRTEPR